MASSSRALYTSASSSWYTCVECRGEQEVSVEDIRSFHDKSTLRSMIKWNISEAPHTTYRKHHCSKYIANFSVNIPCRMCHEGLEVGVRAEATPKGWDVPADAENKHRSTRKYENMCISVLPQSCKYEDLCRDDDCEDHADDSSGDDYGDDYFYDAHYVSCGLYPAELHYDIMRAEWKKAEKERLVTLKIIARSKMLNGFCYLGFDVGTGQIFRPIYRSQKGCCCWEEFLEVSKRYTFRVLMSPEDGLRRLTPLPHSNEDLHIDPTRPPKVLLGGQCGNLFQELQKVAKLSVEEIFGPNIRERRYVEENVDCPSAGILKCNGRDLYFFINEFDKDRVRFGDYEFPLTMVNSSKFWQGLGDQTVLLVLGLGRPFGGTGKNVYSPERCYILVVAIFQARGKRGLLED